MLIASSEIKLNSGAFTAELFIERFDTKDELDFGESYGECFNPEQNFEVFDFDKYSLIAVTFVTSDVVNGLDSTEYALPKTDFNTVAYLYYNGIVDKSVTFDISQDAIIAFVREWTFGVTD